MTAIGVRWAVQDVTCEYCKRELKIGISKVMCKGWNRPLYLCNLCIKALHVATWDLFPKKLVERRLEVMKK